MISPPEPYVLNLNLLIQGEVQYKTASIYIAPMQWSDLSLFSTFICKAIEVMLEGLLYETLQFSARLTGLRSVPYELFRASHPAFLYSGLLSVLGNKNLAAPSPLHFSLLILFPLLSFQSPLILLSSFLLCFLSSHLPLFFSPYSNPIQNICSQAGCLFFCSFLYFFSMLCWTFKLTCAFCSFYYATLPYF